MTARRILRWAVVVAYLVWFYIAFGISWFSGGLRPWVYEVLT